MVAPPLPPGRRWYVPSGPSPSLMEGMQPGMQEWKDHIGWGAARVDFAAIGMRLSFRQAGPGRGEEASGAFEPSWELRRGWGGCVPGLKREPEVMDRRSLFLQNKRCVLILIPGAYFILFLQRSEALGLVLAYRLQPPPSEK